MKTMKLRSTRVKNMRHYKRTNTLTVRYQSGGLYRYSNVTAEIAKWLREQQSLGTALFAITNHPDKYPYVRVG